MSRSAIDVLTMKIVHDPSNKKIKDWNYLLKDGLIQDIDLFKRLIKFGYTKLILEPAK